MITALITSKNRPRVTMVTGKVNSTNMGFTIRFKIARTTATIIAVTYPATLTPGKNLAIRTTANAVNKIRIRNFIIKMDFWLIITQKCKKNAGLNPAFSFL